MKVVLFCGGLGMRVRDLRSGLSKPMLPVGDRPILWHIMKYYGSFGYTDFILCLGYRPDLIESYFSESMAAVERFPAFRLPGFEMRMFFEKKERWSITCVRTGLLTSIGQRLKCVQRLIGNDEIFLANYGDNLTDAPLNRSIAHFKSDPTKIAGMLTAPPSASFHLITSLGNASMRTVTGIDSIRKADLWVNGGYFIFRNQIFDFLAGGNDLVEDAFQELIRDYKLVSWPHRGFWQSLDSPKDYYELNSLFKSGNAPWALWQKRNRPTLKRIPFGAQTPIA